MIYEFEFDVKLSRDDLRRVRVRATSTRLSWRAVRGQYPAAAVTEVQCRIVDAKDRRKGVVGEVSEVTP